MVATRPQVQVYGLVGTVLHMKTTIELPDGLAGQARQVAREQGVPLRELIETGLRAELARRAAPPAAVEFQLRTVGGAGLRPEVNPSQLRERAYEP